MSKTFSKKLDFDVLVVGAGASGVAAACSASSNGARVALIERAGAFGGMATGAHVGTICGLYPRGVRDSELAGEFANEFVERLQNKQGRKELRSFGEELYFLPYESAYFEITCDELLRENNVSVFLHSVCCDALSDGREIKSLKALVWNEVVEFSARAFVDATGEGLLSLILEAEMIEDSELQAPGFVLGVNNVLGELEEKTLNLLVLKELVAAGREGLIPNQISYLSVVPGSLIGNSLHFKLALPFQRKAEFNELTELERFSRQACVRCFDYLKKHVEEFKQASISFLASQLGVRSGRRGAGKEILKAEDVLASRKFSNAVANGLWPVEFWDGERKAKLEYFEDYYQIPEGALISKSFDNLYFCGRGISADSKALSSARVIATSFATGTNAGKLALK